MTKYVKVIDNPNLTILTQNNGGEFWEVLGGGGGGVGTVTNVSATDANGFDFTITNPSTTPNIALAVTPTGILKASGGALSAASAGVDYANLTFKTLSVSGQSDIVADSAADTLTVAAGTGISITTNAGTDTLTITNTVTDTGITQLTGDVTAGPGSGSQVATIANAAVTYAKIQNVTTNKLLGRATAGSGTVEEITLGTGLSYTGTTLNVSGFGDVVGPASAVDDTIATFDGTTGKLIQSTTLSLSGSQLQSTVTNGDFSFVANGSGRVNITDNLSNTFIQVGQNNVTLWSDDGSYFIYSGSSTRGAIFDMTAITASNKTFTFPNTTGTIALRANPSNFTPSTNDGFSLGTTALQWSDLFLAEGGVINWDNGDATLTQTGNTVALAGAGLDIQGSLQADSIVNDTGLAAGTYTPTLTGVANVAASTAYECQYMRVGNTVTVSGKLDIDPTLTATSTQLGISLPVASNFGAAEDCGGVAFAPAIAAMGGAILGDATNDRAQLEFIASDVNNNSMYFVFTYAVI